MSDLSVGLIVGLLTPVALLLVYSIYAMFVYAKDAKKYELLKKQFDGIERVPGPALEVAPSLDWLEESDIDQMHVRRAYSNELKDMADKMARGETVELESATLWISKLPKIIELSKWHGVVEITSVDSQGVLNRKLMTLGIVMATIALYRISEDRDDECIETLRIGYGISNLIKRDNLWINHLISFAGEMYWNRALLEILERRKNNAAFMEQLHETIPPVDLIDEYNSTLEAERRYGDGQTGIDSNSAFKWFPYRRLSTFVSMHVAALFLGRKTVNKAYMAHELPTAIRQAKLKFDSTDSGMAIIEKLKSTDRPVGRWSPYQLAAINIPYQAASTFAAMARSATIRNIYRTAIRIYLASIEERRRVERDRDWFSSDPLLIEFGNEMFTISSIGHGYDVLGADVRVKPHNFLHISFGLEGRLPLELQLSSKS